MTLIEQINADFYPSSLLACPDSYREGVYGYLFATNTSYHRVTNAKPSAPRCKRGAVPQSIVILVVEYCMCGAGAPHHPGNPQFGSHNCIHQRPSA